MSNTCLNKIVTMVLLCCIFSAACNSNTGGKKNDAVIAKPPAMEIKKDSALFAGVKFDSKWDLSCGMPITAGLEDTAHYKGKVYGFCSKACKDDFLKDPATAIKSKQ